MNVTRNRIRLIVLATICLVIGFYSARVVRHHHDKHMRHLTHPAMRTNIWLHEELGLSIVSQPIDETSYLAELCLYRYREKPEYETFTISRQPNESWHEFLVSSKTNLAFVVVRTKQDGGHHSFSRLTKLVLPRGNQALSDVSVETLFTTDSLDIDLGKSWIESIDGVTADGRMLLLSQSFPHAFPSGHTVQRSKAVIYDVEKQKFIDPVFETR